MKQAEVIVQYLYHSGFLVETAKHTLVFDYYKGQLTLGSKDILVFCSHGHADHYNPHILQWQKDNASIHYIFSDDIKVESKNEKIISLPPYAKAAINETKITTYGSSDLGVSFLVNCDGISVFHAGDLNWWHWRGESAQEIAFAEKLFKAEIAKIKGSPIDIAFFPVDPRLEDSCNLGADYFIQELAPTFLIPMHFAEDTEVVKNYAQTTLSSRTTVCALTKPGQSINLSF